MQQLWVDVIVGQPVRTDFGDLVEQLARGVLVAHEEAGVGHCRAGQRNLQARQQGGRYRVGALPLLHLLHEHAQQVEVVAVVAAQLGLGAMLAAQLGDHRCLQVGHAGGGTGLGLQASEHRVDGGAGDGAGFNRGGGCVAGLLQQLMQGTAGGGSQADDSGTASVVDGVLYQMRPRAGGGGAVPTGQRCGRLPGRLRGATAAHRLGDDPPCAGGARQIRGVDQPRQDAVLGQQGVGAIQYVAQALQHLALEAAVQRQLDLRAKRILFGQPAHDQAQRLRCQRQGVRFECRCGGQHAQALSQQIQRVGRALGFAPYHFGQQQVAIHVVLGDQRQALHAWQGRRGRGRRAGTGRFAQPCQRLGQGIQHAIREVAGKGMQLAALGHKVGLLRRIAGAVGIVQQGLFQCFDGQDQGRGQCLPAQADQRAQQIAHPRWQLGGGQAVLVGGGKGEDS